MTILQKAMAEAARLPEADQDEIGHQILAYLRALAELRADLDHGVRSLDEGRGKAIELADLLVEARRRHAKG